MTDISVESMNSVISSLQLDFCTRILQWRQHHWLWREFWRERNKQIMLYLDIHVIKNK